MIRVLGSPKQLCDGLTRRDLLHVGSLSMLGLGLSSLSRGRSALAENETRPASFGRAKSCILLYLYGAPSQIETFDPKPDAPEGVRGELGSIPSVVPGLDVCDQLPRLAKVMDRATVVRSMTHPYPIHGVAFALTGIPQIQLAMELNPRDPNQWPFVGSVVDYLDGQSAPGTIPDVPRNLVLPWAFSSQRVGEVARAGPYGGFLGPSFDPVSTEFVGEGTKKAVKTLQEQRWEDFELYRGITPSSRFQLSSVSNVGPELTLDRLNRRRSLLEQFEAARPELDRAVQRAGSGIDRQRAMAYAMLGSDKLRQAFDLDQEPPEIRDRYGMTLFGQASLTARRLVEAGDGS